MILGVYEEASVADMMAWTSLTNEQRASILRVLVTEIRVSQYAVDDGNQICNIANDVLNRFHN